MCSAFFIFKKTTFLYVGQTNIANFSTNQDEAACALMRHYKILLSLKRHYLLIEWSPVKLIFASCTLF